MKNFTVAALFLIALNMVSSFRVAEGCGCQKRPVHEREYQEHREACEDFKPKESCEDRVCKLNAQIAELNQTIKDQKYEIHELKEHCHAKRRNCDKKPRSWEKESCGCSKEDREWGNDSEWGFGEDADRTQHARKSVPMMSKPVFVPRASTYVHQHRAYAPAFKAPAYVPKTCSVGSNA